MKVALITGGSRGIGAETAKKFANEHYTVIINYSKSVEAAEALKRELVDDGFDAHLYRANVADVTQVAEMFAWVDKYFKKLDVLVNNAGIALTKQIQDVTETDFDSVTDVNAKGMFFCCQQAMPLLAKSGNGSIVNVSSIWGVKGASCESVYAMSKFAVVGLTKSLSEELKGAGIRVNCICPPIVLTDMSRHLSESDIEEFTRQQGAKAYLPQEVAKDIFKLATNKSTGKILREK